MTSIYGIGHHTAHRLCARFQIHDRCRAKDLTPYQVTAIASFLSSPANAPRLTPFPLASPDFTPPPPTKSLHDLQTELNNARAASKQRKEARLAKRRPSSSLNPVASAKGAQAQPKNRDPLYDLKIESELKREIRENIAHQRMIGSYVGRRHVMHLPVRGQNTQSNAKTAKKLNQLERKG